MRKSRNTEFYSYETTKAQSFTRDNVLAPSLSGVLGDIVFHDVFAIETQWGRITRIEVVSHLGTKLFKTGL